MCPSSLLTPPSRAENAASGKLLITLPWSRATPNGAKVTGARYFMIEEQVSAGGQRSAVLTAPGKGIGSH